MQNVINKYKMKQEEEGHKTEQLSQALQSLQTTANTMTTEEKLKET